MPQRHLERQSLRWCAQAAGLPQFQFQKKKRESAASTSMHIIHFVSLWWHHNVVPHRLRYPGCSYHRGTVVVWHHTVVPLCKK